MTPEELIERCRLWRPSKPDFDLLIWVAVREFACLPDLASVLNVGDDDVFKWIDGSLKPEPEVQRRAVVLIAERASYFRRVTNVSPAHTSYKGNPRPTKRTKSVWFVDNEQPTRQEFLMNCFSVEVAERVVELWNAEAERLRAISMAR